MSVNGWATKRRNTCPWITSAIEGIADLELSPQAPPWPCGHDRIRPFQADSKKSGIAEEYRARREAQLWDRSVTGEPGTHTFGEAVLNYLQNKNPGPSFRLTLLRPVYHFEHRPADAITQDAVDQYIAANHSTSAPGTIVRAVITPLTAVLRVAAKRGWCELPNFDRPTIPKRKPRWLQHHEAAAPTMLFDNDFDIDGIPAVA